MRVNEYVSVRTSTGASKKKISKKKLKNIMHGTMIITIFKKINDQSLHLYRQDVSLYVRAFMFCVGVLSL